jgi:hypothetical protein
MPNWKKVIVSGSDASLNSLFVLTSITGSSFTGSFTGSLFGTSSWASNAVTASYALTASHAINGGVTQILAGANVTVAPTNGQGQVTISATGGGGSTFNTATGSYGSFYDTTTQTNVAGTARSMSFNTTDITNGVSISGSTNPFNTYIKTENAGVYDIQFSAQVDKTDSGTDEIWIWLRKNGTNLQDTATSIQLTGNGDHYVAAWNFFVNSAANDYYQLMWYSSDANVRLHAEPGFGVVPGIPSVIATVNRVDQFLSNTGSFSGSFTGSLFGTSSWANNALTSSYILNAVSSSFAFTASFVKTAQTASYILQAVSSSFASTASFINTLNQNVLINGGISASSYLYSTIDVIAQQNLKSINSVGDEGGEILLGKPQTNTTLTGSGVTIDVYQNRLRFFEQGGDARGYFIDITGGGAGASTNLVGGGGTPGGSNTQIQYNNAGAFGGVSTLTFDGTTLRATGSFTGSLVGALTGTASYATQALTASYVAYASSFPYTGSALITGSLGVTGSISIGSALLDFNQNTNVVTGSYQVIASEATASYRTAFFDYVIFSGSISRAGTIYTVWSGSTTEWYENYTSDIGGSTNGVQLQTAISSGNIQLQATASTAAWTIRSLVRML